MKLNLLLTAFILLVFTACTTKEMNNNADKVGDGVKNIEQGVEDIIEGKN